MTNYYEPGYLIKGYRLQLELGHQMKVTRAASRMFKTIVNCIYIRLLVINLAGQKKL